MHRLLRLFPWFGTHVRVLVPTDQPGKMRAVALSSLTDLPKEYDLLLIRYFRILGWYFILKVTPVRLNS